MNGVGETLRILMILRAPVGGLYRHVIDLSSQLIARGHQVGLVMDSSLSDPRTDQRLSGMETAPQLGVHRIPIPRLLGPADLLATGRIRRIARQCGAQVLHGHGAKGGFYARLAHIGRPDQAAIYTPHGGVLHFEQSSGVGKLLRGIEKGLFGLTDAIIFESRFARASFERQIGLPECLTPVVHNGLLPDEFKPLADDTVDHDFAYVGELRHLKGIHVLLDALTAITNKGRPARLIIGGGGPDEEETRQQIARLGLETRVTMAGVKPALQVFARGQVAVMPSLAESLPYVALEAAAAGKPLIATDVGGVKEIFGPTASSLVAPGDSGALAKALQRCLDQPVEAATEAEKRRDWIREQFSVGKMTDGIERCYQEALSRRGKR
ncbi:MAG TPA: glycosyltransferase family 1 protein [Devosia sp.]|nr:glycosyltransferase family 1 protein [Devosia sp.]